MCDVSCSIGDEVWSKMTYLRDQRKKIDKKIADSKKSGTGADDVVQPTVWWYELTSFLTKDSTSTTTADNLNVSFTLNTLK